MKVSMLFVEAVTGLYERCVGFGRSTVGVAS